MGIWKKFFGGVSFVGLSGFSYLCYDIHRYRVYSDQSFEDAARHYMSVRSLTILGSTLRRKLEEASKDVEAAQAKFLMDQIKENLNTEYSRDMQLDEINSVQDFIKKHRLTYPHDYTRYIGRMMSGEKNVLTAKEPTVFAVTSGTSGKSNIIPMVGRQTKLFFLERSSSCVLTQHSSNTAFFSVFEKRNDDLHSFLKHRNGISVLYNCMIEAFPDTKFLNKDLKIFFTPNWRHSVNGIPIGPNSASPERSKDLLHIYTTPAAAYGVKSEPEALYLYLLFALLDPHVGMVEANFASIIYNAMSTLETNLSQLTLDIELGRIDPGLSIDPKIRDELNALMNPNPERANQIRDAAKHGKEGLALRIWPELHILLGADTGTFEIYGDKLRNGICRGIPLYSPIYAASEGLLGINIWPKQLPSRYLLHPRTQFFEFIPESKMDEEEPKTFLLHQVEDGQTYEMVITNPSCLYRYRFGDVVKVVGFYNSCPIVEFKYRKGQFLNVRGEKTSEALFYDVLKDTANQMEDNVRLVDYCCTESVLLEDVPKPRSLKSSQPCYHVFLELDSNQDKKAAQQISKNQQKKLDDALMAQSYPYSSFRQKGSIAPVKVHVVKQGSFSQLRSLMVNQTSATSNQYKVPRVLRKQDALKFMVDQIVS